MRPRGETLRFDQTDRDVREAGRVLDVDVVVDGSLRRVGDVVRVSVRASRGLDVMGRVLVEIGRTDLGFATLRRALASEPQLTHARQALARGIGLLGDLETAREVVGPLSQAEGDLVPQLLLRVRFALERDVALRPQLSARGRRNILAIVHIIRTRSLSSELAQDLQGSLALDTRFMPRRLCFHAQMRIECKLGAREIEGALADLRVAGANGLIDLLWLDHCPLFEGLRDHPEFVAVRESTNGRVDRILRVLVP